MYVNGVYLSMHYCRKKGQKIKRKHLFPNRNVGESNARLFYSSKLSLSNQWVTMTSFASWHTKTHNLKYFFYSKFFFFFSPHHMRVVPVKFKTTWKKFALSSVFFWGFLRQKVLNHPRNLCPYAGSSRPEAKPVLGDSPSLECTGRKKFFFALSLSLKCSLVSVLYQECCLWWLSPVQDHEVKKLTHAEQGLPQNTKLLNLTERNKALALTLSPFQECFSSCI